MKLNCDLGEFDGDLASSVDSQIMPLIDMANVACGFHASNANVMFDVVALANTHDVKIGAHPGYQDKENFGRKHIALSHQEITNLLSYQVGALQSIASLHQARVSYVKPHGALYHAMMDDEQVFEAILKAVAATPFKMELLILSSTRNETYNRIAQAFDVRLMYEGFLDRAYNADGNLVSREEPDALITDLSAIKSQLENIKDGRVQTRDGAMIDLHIDTVCVHSDTPNAIELIKQIRAWM